MRITFYIYRVDKEWRVLNVFGVIVVIWLLYNESRRIELSFMKFLFLI